jgi:hypothetical protein
LLSNCLSRIDVHKIVCKRGKLPTAERAWNSRICDARFMTLVMCHLLRITKYFFAFWRRLFPWGMQILSRKVVAVPLNSLSFRSTCVVITNKFKHQPHMRNNAKQCKGLNLLSIQTRTTGRALCSRADSKTFQQRHT